MKVKGSRQRGLIMLAVLGIGTLIAVVVVLISVTTGGGAGPQPTATAPAQSDNPSPSSTKHDSGEVDPSVVELGWTPEPITQDPDLYARAALEAAGTFDTRLATRSEWVEWLETWFTPSPLYDDEQDGLDQMGGYKAELNDSVLLPQGVWDDLAGEDGRVDARVIGEVEYLDLPETTAEQIWTATADVVVTYTRSADTDGGQLTYDETIRVSVQVVCGGVSVPTPNSLQRAGDCKVIRFFDAAVD